jgi:hypothetical protein
MIAPCQSHRPGIPRENGERAARPARRDNGDRLVQCSRSGLLLQASFAARMSLRTEGAAPEAALSQLVRCDRVSRGPLRRSLLGRRWRSRVMASVDLHAALGPRRSRPDRRPWAQGWRPCGGGGAALTDWSVLTWLPGSGSSARLRRPCHAANSGMRRDRAGATRAAPASRAATAHNRCCFMAHAGRRAGG